MCMCRSSRCLKSFKYGKQGHHSTECKSNVPTCYNCGEPGHISIQFQKLRKALAATQANARVFPLSGMDILRSDNLIQGMCLIDGVSLISMIDIGVTHLFVSLDCVKKLNLIVSFMIGSMIIDTPSAGSVTTSLVCLDFPLKICGEGFRVDLICLYLSQLNVILGMKWLEFNCVLIIS